MELVNETVGRWRDWGYCYYVIDRDHMLQHSAYMALPKDSYVYRARVENKIIWVAQVPLGVATSRFLLVHGDSVVKPLPSILQR